MNLRPFLERYYDSITDHLNEDRASVRYPNSKRYQDLLLVETKIWEALLQVSGREATLSYAETDIELDEQQEFYPFPGNFRNFISFEKRTAGDRNQLTGRLNTISSFQGGPGIEILSPERGFIVRPKGATGTWTLCYNKRPILLHYAKAKSVTSTTLEMSDPAQDAGILVTRDGYYNRSEVRLYQGGGTPQTHEVASHIGKTLTFSTPWTPLPTGEIWYEFVPLSRTL